MKKIALFGICGKMGKSMLSELIMEEDISIVAGFDRINIGTDIGVLAGREISGVKVTDNYEDIKIAKPDLIIDFTGPEIVYKNVLWAIENKLDIIVGATGLKKEEVENIRKKAVKSASKIFIVPNFSVGAVLMMILSSLAAPYFENCEIIEMHHDKKKDAPSGTAIATSMAISEKKNFNLTRFLPFEKETLEGSRGAFSDGIHIHSIRLPGLLAHQSVIFGSKGQTLIIKHDSIDRSSYYPGLILAIKNIDKLPVFSYGLDSLIKI
ncbi:MAG: 4-hydroxy-tetrahydrodipicolinate reductase [Actinobacteria bacterium]|nr:4-hydroxy-tetrahydrodipicolinate reductase [Actinomycetota bacterium]MCL6087358.1 4-hydroxy-tetrahydrodipicolinate reductase [Actinomycetota bacterium]